MNPLHGINHTIMLALHQMTFQAISKSQTIYFLSCEKKLWSFNVTVACSHDVGCLVYGGQEKTVLRESFSF